MLGWSLHMLIALSTGSVILALESTIHEFSLIFRVFVAFWKKCPVPLILKYHQIGCFLHSPQELFCLRIFSFQKKEVRCFSKMLCYL